MIKCCLQELRPKLKGGKVEYTVLESTQVEVELLPVLGKSFRYWVKGARYGTAPVEWIECPLQGGYTKTYQFTTRAAPPPGQAPRRAQAWRVTIMDPIFAGT